MSDEELTQANIGKLKVADLKKELKQRGLSILGNKGELAERLMQAMQQNKIEDGSVAGSVDELIDEDEVLNDEEIEDEINTNLELEVSDKSFECESTASAKPILKRKSSEATSESTDIATKTKKITLNRHLSDETPISQNVIPEIKPTTNGEPDEKKVVKLSELSAKERLEMRAKKFGAPLSVEAKKQVRAERFSGQPVTAAAKKTVSLNNSGTDIERLKKRAERFGSTVSTQLSKVEKQEKLEQRKARFGLSTTTNGSTLEMQKAKRLERFK